MLLWQHARFQSPASSVFPVVTQQSKYLVLSKALFTWREGNPAGRVTLLGGLPSYINFPRFVYMGGRVTLPAYYYYSSRRVMFLFI